MPHDDGPMFPAPSPSPRPGLPALAWVGFGLAFLGMVGWIGAAVWMAAHGVGQVLAAASPTVGCDGVPDGAAATAAREIRDFEVAGRDTSADDDGCDSYDGGPVLYLYRQYAVTGDDDPLYGRLGARAAAAGWTRVDSGVFRRASDGVVTCVWVGPADETVPSRHLSVELEVVGADADAAQALCSAP